MSYDRAYKTRYYEQNRDRIAQYNKRWRQQRRLSHPGEAVAQNERVKVYQQTPTGQAALTAGRLNTMARKRSQKGRVDAHQILTLPDRCAECGDIDSLEIDHIVPAMHGGLNTIENIQRLCGACHQAKTNREKAVRVDVVSPPPLEQLELFAMEKAV
jgi:5-methylcytosine-specific restriction endonuclease McrA